MVQFATISPAELRGFFMLAVVGWPESGLEFNCGLGFATLWPVQKISVDFSQAKLVNYPNFPSPAGGQSVIPPGTKVVFSLLWAMACLTSLGCAEGPLWRTGHLAPWVRQQWERESEIVPTVESRGRELETMIDRAVEANDRAALEQIGTSLAQIVAQDPVLLMRVEATRLYGRLPVEIAASGLQKAGESGEAEIRLAAIAAWQQISDERGVAILQGLALGDTNVDVRIAAVRAMSEIPSEQSKKALALALDDPSPAVQLRATEGLTELTGESFGGDVQAWRDFFKGR